MIPGTPLISAGMEQFNDTPVVNGTAYPTVTLEPASYRLRILNAANDRFWNLQWYVADESTASTGLNAWPGHRRDRGGAERGEVAAAQLDPVVFPTPDLAKSPAGPDWIVIGTEGGFLPNRPSSTASRSPPGSPTRPASTPGWSTSTRCCCPRPSGPT
jgi:FtsP/CotA-like multicopper oxidase with cupredoxin domain